MSKNKKSTKKKILLLSVLSVGLMVNGVLMPTAPFLQQQQVQAATTSIPENEVNLPEVPLEYVGTSYLQSFWQYESTQIPVGDKIFLFGGHLGGGYTSVISVFDTKTNEYKRVGNFPYVYGMYGNSAFLADDGFIYILGGYSGNNGYKNYIWRFNPETYELKIIGNTPIGFAQGTLVKHSNGKVYILGVQGTSGTWDNGSILEYTPGSNTATIIANPYRWQNIYLRDGHAYEGTDGGIYYIGGQKAWNGGTSSNIVKFDVNAKTASVVGSIDDGGRKSYASFKIDNDVYLFGGEDYAYVDNANIMKVNLENFESELISRLTSEDSQFQFLGGSAVLMDNGDVYYNTAGKFYKAEFDALKVDFKANYNNETKETLLTWGYDDEETTASSYEVLRNNEVIYSGTDTSFVDKNLFGNQKYTYTVRVKDKNGNILGNRNQIVQTPYYSNLVVSQPSEGVIDIKFIYEKDYPVDFELLRGTEVIYNGEDINFLDDTFLGATDYTYTLNVKDKTGKLLETRQSTPIKTPIFNPSNVFITENTGDTLKVSWSHNRNPEATEYSLTATPKGEENIPPVIINEGFEGASVFPTSGNWYRTAIDRASGMYSLRSSAIGHSGSTTSNLSINIPANAVNAKVSFKYKVSSEAGCDWFKASLNGNQIIRDSGIKSWVTATGNLKPGTNTLSFNYSKDSSVVRGSDLALVDAIEVSYEMTDRRYSGWIKGNEYTFTNLNTEKEYGINLVARHNGETSETIAATEGNNQLQVATDAVTDLETLIEQGLETQEKINVAQEKIVEVSKIVSELPNSEEKNTLENKIDEAQKQVTLAQNILNAKNAIAELETLVSGDLTTQISIDNAQNQLVLAQEKVDVLQEGELKTELQGKIDVAQDKIDLAQDILNAKNAVAEVETLVNADLTTQVSIDNAQSKLNEAVTLVSKLPESELKDELLSKLTDAQNKIFEAQAILDVATAEGNKTQENVDKAKESIVKLDDGELKKSLTERIEVVQKIIDANTILDTLLDSDFTTFESIDKAISDLEKAVEIINTLPSSNDKETLLAKVEKTKTHLAKELISVIEANQSGKPVRLSLESLDILIQYAIQETGATSIKDKGQVLSYVMKIANKHTTGIEINTLIANYLK